MFGLGAAAMLGGTLLQSIHNALIKVSDNKICHSSLEFVADRTIAMIACTGGRCIKNSDTWQQREKKRPLGPLLKNWIAVTASP